ncbi:YmaF family protein [Clostridium sp.]|nr:YmaF family protein [Clostridium sp.]MDU2156603.1 YmaF family protein [Clostridium sp.]
MGNGKHIHLTMATTTFVQGHVHEFIFTTLIEAPEL